MFANSGCAKCEVDILIFDVVLVPRFTTTHCPHRVVLIQNLNLVPYVRFMITNYAKMRLTDRLLEF